MGSDPPRESTWGCSGVVTCWLWVLELELGPHPGWSLKGEGQAVPGMCGQSNILPSLSSQRGWE